MVEATNFSGLNFAGGFLETRGAERKSVSLRDFNLAKQGGLQNPLASVNDGVRKADFLEAKAERQGEVVAERGQGVESFQTSRRDFHDIQDEVVIRNTEDSGILRDEGEVSIVQVGNDLDKSAEAGSNINHETRNSDVAARLEARENQEVFVREQSFERAAEVTDLAQRDQQDTHALERQARRDEFASRFTATDQPDNNPILDRRPAFPLEDELVLRAAAEEDNGGEATRRHRAAISEIEASHDAAVAQDSVSDRTESSAGTSDPFDDIFQSSDPNEVPTAANIAQQREQQDGVGSLVDLFT
ncbi:MAG: hypothetical protein HOO00_01390 [Rhodospirillaceae bacterium]|jgi:hypothetical protein|nr:hypothetical protein [Rhodospirillaceae bacterium]MBT5374337.1 hypothetical protein [Rhodospirillaceae bacterium]MBT5751891.1 hypothetical protein [Rhodospirillaceae bacterium]